MRRKAPLANRMANRGDKVELSLPALDLVYSEVSDEYDSRDRTLGSLDTKAASAIGFFGALAAFAEGSAGTAAGAGRIVSVVAAAMCAFALFPRKVPGRDPKAFRSLASKSEADAKLEILDWKIWAACEMAVALRSKAARLKRAAIVGAVGFALIVGGTIASAVR